MIGEVESTPQVLDDTPRFRPIMTMTYSGFRDGLRCLQWDDRLRAMVEVTLPEDDPWGHIAILAAANESKG